MQKNIHNKAHKEKDPFQSTKEIWETEAAPVEFLSKAQPDSCFLAPILSLRFQLSEPEAEPLTLAM